MNNCRFCGAPIEGGRCRNACEQGNPAVLQVFRQEQRQLGRDSEHNLILDWSERFLDDLLDEMSMDPQITVGMFTRYLRHLRSKDHRS